MIELVNGFNMARNKKNYIAEQARIAGITYESLYEMLQSNGAIMGTVPKHFTKQTQAEKQAAKKEIAELKVSEQEARYQENIRQLMAEVKELWEQLDAASCVTVQSDDSELRATIEDLIKKNSRLIEDNNVLNAAHNRALMDSDKWQQKYEDCSRYADSLEESNRKLTEMVDSLASQPVQPSMTQMERAMLNMAMQIFGGDDYD